MIRLLFVMVKMWTGELTGGLDPTEQRAGHARQTGHKGAWTSETSEPTLPFRAAESRQKGVTQGRAVH
jgi:hypothetical protein